MSSITSSSTCTTGTLLFLTGLAHNVLGIISPRLREPLLRIIADGGTVSVKNNPNERYARDNTFWFQFAGIALMIHGIHVRSLLKQLQSLDPKAEDEFEKKYLGWTMLLTGLFGVFCKPDSGFHMVYPQGLYFLWIHRNNNNNNKQVEDEDGEDDGKKKKQ